MKALQICNCKQLQKWRWKKIRTQVFLSLLAWCLLLFCAVQAPANTASTAFKLHLRTEPNSPLLPQKHRSSNSSYLMMNLHRNLLFFDDQLGLKPDLAESCVTQKKTIICKIKKNAKWSDGSDLLAEDFLRAYQFILDVNNQAFRADLFFTLKNAQDIYLGKKNKDLLGVKAIDNKTLKFEFEPTKNPQDFIHNLSNVILAPLKRDLFSGPYQIKNWDKGNFITLEQNKNYHIKNNRPELQFLFIDDDHMSIKLFEKNQLDFARRLPTSEIVRFKDRKEFFHQVEVARFDYIGFGPSLKNNLSLRTAISNALNYPDLKKILASDGLPGCPGIPASWLFKELLCYSFDLTQAKKHLADLKTKVKSLDFYFSTQGDEDHRRVAEWFQEQFKNNLQIQLKLFPTENKLFLETLSKNPPDLFRKGISPDQPTCASLLAAFTSDHRENFIDLQGTETLKLIEKISSQSLTSCSKAINSLMKTKQIIPLGPIHFSLLANPKFTGWKLNQLNQLDLSGLKFNP
jgi:oligopeptide transport system substrate-binding protein